MTNILNQFSDISLYEKKRKRHLKMLNKPESLFSRSMIANLLLIVFCVADFVTVYDVWNLLLVQSRLMLILIVIAFVIALDVTMSIAGNVLKQYHQGLRKKKDTYLIVAACVGSFAVVYVFYLLLRIAMKDMVFADIGTTSNLVDMTNQSAETTESEANNLVSWFATLALAVSPLATSLASFGVTYAVSNPIEEKIYDLTKVQYEIESDISSIRCIIAQSGDVDTYVKNLYNREENLYTAFINSIDSTAQALEINVDTIIMEKLGEQSADSITDMTNDGKRKLEAFENIHNSNTSTYLFPGVNTDLLTGSSDNKIIKAS